MFFRMRTIFCVIATLFCLVSTFNMYFSRNISFDPSINEDCLNNSTFCPVDEASRIGKHNKVIMIWTDSVPVFSAKKIFQTFNDHSLRFKVKVSGTLVSHAIFTSMLTGQPTTNYRNAKIESDNIVKSFHRSGRKLEYIGPTLPVLMLLTDDDINLFSRMTEVSDIEEKMMQLWNEQNVDRDFARFRAGNESTLRLPRIHPALFGQHTEEAAQKAHLYKQLDGIKQRGADLVAYSATLDSYTHVGARMQPMTTAMLTARLTHDIALLKEWIDLNPDYTLMLFADHGFNRRKPSFVLHGVNTHGNEGFAVIYHPSFPALSAEWEKANLQTIIESLEHHQLTEPASPPAAKEHYTMEQMRKMGVFMCASDRSSPPPPLPPQQTGHSPLLHSRQDCSPTAAFRADLGNLLVPSQYLGTLKPPAIHMRGEPGPDSVHFPSLLTHLRQLAQGQEDHTAIATPDWHLAMQTIDIVDVLPTFLAYAGQVDIPLASVGVIKLSPSAFSPEETRALQLRNLKQLTASAKIRQVSVPQPQVVQSFLEHSGSPPATNADLQTIEQLDVLLHQLKDELFNPSQFLGVWPSARVLLATLLLLAVFLTRHLLPLLRQDYRLLFSTTPEELRKKSGCTADLGREEDHFGIVHHSAMTAPFQNILPYSVVVLFRLVAVCLCVVVLCTVLLPLCQPQYSQLLPKGLLFPPVFLIVAGSLLTTAVLSVVALGLPLHTLAPYSPLLLLVLAFGQGETFIELFPAQFQSGFSQFMWTLVLAAALVVTCKPLLTALLSSVVLFAVAALSITLAPVFNALFFSANGVHYGCALAVFLCCSAAVVGVVGPWLCPLLFARVPLSSSTRNRFLHFFSSPHEEFSRVNPLTSTKEHAGRTIHSFPVFVELIAVALLGLNWLAFSGAAEKKGALILLCAVARFVLRPLAAAKPPQMDQTHTHALFLTVLCCVLPFALADAFVREPINLEFKADTGLVGLSSFMVCPYCSAFWMGWYKTGFYFTALALFLATDRVLRTDANRLYSLQNHLLQLFACSGAVAYHILLRVYISAHEDGAALLITLLAGALAGLHFILTSPFYLQHRLFPSSLLLPLSKPRAL